MAERRMFAKTIVLSDAFLDMPMSARCLYFTLGMLADDDGFVNAPRSIMRQCGASEDDMRVLLAKKFVLEFETGVIVIKHWRINNYLRNDRYSATKYADEKEQLFVDENGGYTFKHVGVPALEEHNLLPLEQDPTGERRRKAYKESGLPYSFSYKIRNAFARKPCPVCGCTMENYEKSPTFPTIQHNIPISKGGKHELSNISVICRSCNLSIQDQETGPLNNKEVIAEWEKISGIPNNGIPSIGKDRLGKDSIESAQKCEDENGVEKRFEKFWEAYANKKGKKNAHKAFLKINPDEELFAKIMEGVNQYHKSRNWLEGYRKDPATWLNGECWEDDYSNESRPIKTVSAQQYKQRDYTEEELDAVSADLFEEARAFARREKE